MNRYILFALAAFGLLMTQTLVADPETREFEIDLASVEPNGSVSETIRIQEDVALTIVIKNILPGKDYTVSAESKSESIPSMELSLNKHSNNCAQTYEEFKLDLFDLEDEKDIPKLKEAFYAKIAGNCVQASARSRYKDSVEKFIEYEVFPKGLIIKPGSEVNIVITRKDLSGAEVKRTIVYTAESTEPGGDWKLSYGFAFPIMLSEDETYFSKLSDSLDNRFEISSKKNNDVTKFIPAIFLTWMPNQNLFENWSYCFTAGLGFDFENPTIFAGGAITYNQKLNLLYGFVAHKLSRLNGKYKEGQIISENLSAAQLHDYSYRLNLFVGLSYSFD